jgi:hypothetical protein
MPLRRRGRAVMSAAMLATSAGIFGCCAAMLPSSFAMCLVSLATASLLHVLAPTGRRPHDRLPAAFNCAN